jgi:hypothetical protein
MPSPEPDANAEWNDLPGDCVIYRSVLNKPGRDKVTGKILRQAFLRRKPKEDGTPRDVDGLSVALFLEDDITQEQIIDRVRNDFCCYAIAKLHVQPVRDIETEPSLDVVRDGKNHANITGLPAYGENVVKAEWLAGLLADLAGDAIWWDRQALNH